MGYKFGIDPFFDLIPGLEILPTVLSFYIIWVAYLYELPMKELIWMVFRIIFDFLLGAIPFLGTIADFVYKSNEKNLQVLDRYSPEGLLEGEVLSK